MQGQKLKIAFVSQEYPPETARGGIGTQTYIKAQGLASLGHHIFVISRSINNDRSEKEDGKVTVIRVPGMDTAMPEMTDIVHWITHSVVIAAELESLHKRIELDVIDFPEWAAEAYTYLLNRTSWKRACSVIQLHGPLVMFGDVMSWFSKESNFYKVGIHMEATCVQLCDAVYSSSECSADWIRKYYKPKSEDIPVIHLGVDAESFSPKAVEKHNNPTIIFSGKIVQNKGVEELVEAAAMLTPDFPGVRLRMIGRVDEKYKSYLVAFADKLGAPALIDFAGFIQKDKLAEELCKAHVFAAPSYYEGGPGFVYLEAMSCGLPVVGCSGSGIDEIITSGKNGVLVPPKNVEALTVALHGILKDEALQKTLGTNARKYVLAEADSSNCLRKLESFYQSTYERWSEKMKMAEYE